MQNVYEVDRLSVFKRNESSTTSKALAALGAPRPALRSLASGLRCLRGRGTADRRSPFQSARTAGGPSIILVD